MWNQNSKRSLMLGIISFLLLILSGCGGAPLYQGTLGTGLQMTPFKMGKVDLSLPPGWRGESNPKNDIYNVKLVKDGGPSIFIGCMGMFFSKDQLGKIAREAILAATPNAIKTKGPFRLDTGFQDVTFEGYTGTSVAEGREITIHSYSAWKLDSGIGGCKYSIFAAANESQASGFENEFIAILRTLR